MEKSEENNEQQIPADVLAFLSQMGDTDPDPASIDVDMVRAIMASYQTIRQERVRAEIPTNSTAEDKADVESETGTDVKSEKKQKEKKVEQIEPVDIIASRNPETLKRCAGPSCKKKITLTMRMMNTCKCRQVFCNLHRIGTKDGEGRGTHKCDFDYATEGKKLIQDQNSLEEKRKHRGWNGNGGSENCAF